MKDREQRKLPLKAATLFVGAVLAIGGGVGMYEGIVNEDRAEDQAGQRIPQPGRQLVTDAKAAIPFLERDKTPAYLQTWADAQDILDRDKVFKAELHESDLFKRSKKEFLGGIGGVLTGIALVGGEILHGQIKEAIRLRERDKRMSYEESAF